MLVVEITRDDEDYLEICFILQSPATPVKKRLESYIKTMIIGHMLVVYTS